jgi:hypothetical protein
VFGKYIQNLEHQIVLNESTESSAVVGDKLNISEVADHSLLVNESEVDMVPIHFNINRPRVYNIKYPIREIEFFEGPRMFK